MEVLRKMGLSEEEIKLALKQADLDLQAGLLSKKSTALSVVETKTTLLEEFYAGETHISASRFMVLLNAKGAQLTSCRHLGDHLGFGRSGMNLASVKNYDPKNKNKKFYRIPDPSQFSAWYNGQNPVLPKEYYSDDELRLVMAHLRKRTLNELKKEV